MKHKVMQIEYCLHGSPVHFTMDDADIIDRLRKQWAPFAPSNVISETSESPPQPIQVFLSTVPSAPPPPDSPPVSIGPTMTYYRTEDYLTAFIPHWGRFDVNLETNEATGIITQACIDTYGVFEDMIIVALAPLLRRRGFYTIHAFAAAVDDKAAVLIGDIGAGKSTTGISLLCQGARLISNDSPLLHIDELGYAKLYAYPGMLSTYPDTLAWFPNLSDVVDQATRMDGSEKLSFALDDAWPDQWAMASSPSALFFPKISTNLTASSIEPLSGFQALQQLVGQSIENWDHETIPLNLRALRTLVDSAPAYELRLAPDIERIPELIFEAMQG